MYSFKLINHPYYFHLNRSYNISICDSFPYNKLNDRIRDENGTIGYCIRLKKIKDRVRFF